MHVLMVAAENDALPNAKVGGVADVIRDVPKALVAQGLTVDVVIPDYGFEEKGDVELGFHVGYHHGDFNEFFNGVPDSYIDYNVSLSKDGFSFMISGTDVDDVGPDNLDNDELKFVVGYSVDIEL